MTDASIPAVELRIYQSFSEVRTLVQSDADHLELTFPAATWATIDETSITLLGLPYTSKTVVARDSWLSAFEGRRLWLRRPDGREDVTLIRAEDVLVQDSSGAHFRVTEADLLFPDVPPARGQEGVVTLTFQLPDAGEGVLTYVTRSLTWSAHYLLEINADGNGQLRGDATLHNRTALTFEPTSLTLVAGELREAPARHQRPRLQALLTNFRVMPPSWQDDDLAAEQPEIAGLYRFELHHPPRLAGSADVSVPFDDVPLQDTTLSAVLTHPMTFSSVVRGVFRRRYRLVAGRALLSAKVTVRDQGYLVGEQNVTETAPGEAVNLLLGRDPNMTYRREVTRLHSEDLPESEERAGLVDRFTLTTYRIRYELRNAGTRRVPYEVTEPTGFLTITEVRGDVERQTDAVTFSGVLEPAEVKIVEFEVVHREEVRRR